MSDAEVVEERLLNLSTGEIDADVAWNTRQTYVEDKLVILGKEIKANGQISPIIVAELERAEGDDGPAYALLAGFRRYKAVCMTDGLDTLKAVVHVLDSKLGVEAEALRINIGENLNREGLGSYEVACACVRLRDSVEPPLSGNKISNLLRSGNTEVVDNNKGMTKGHVNNLISAVECLIPEVLEAWKNDDDKASVRQLFKLKALSKEDQKLTWDKWCGVPGAGNGGGDADPDKDPPIKPPRNVSKGHLLKAMAVMESQPDKLRGNDTWQAAHKTLKWCLGLSKTLRLDNAIVYDPKKNYEPKD